MNQISIKKNLYYVKTKKINKVIKNKFDFLNIDIEGFDFKVLKSINLYFYKPKLICIEILDKNKIKPVSKFLKSCEYMFIKKNWPKLFF